MNILMEKQESNVGEPKWRACPVCTFPLPSSQILTNRVALSRIWEFIEHRSLLILYWALSHTFRGGVPLLPARSPSGRIFYGSKTYRGGFQPQNQRTLSRSRERSQPLPQKRTKGPLELLNQNERDRTQQDRMPPVWEAHSFLEVRQRGPSSL